uniref:Uncharacterized protein n=1 Tax=Lutzomyia longipalpis TaxID=7200 RepID=A0A1B0EVT1_LUTLO
MKSNRETTSVNMSKKTLAGGKNAWKVEKTQTKFAQVQKKHLEAAKKLVKEYESSSDEEDVVTADIFEAVLKGYDVQILANLALAEVFTVASVAKNARNVIAQRAFGNVMLHATKSMIVVDIDVRKSAIHQESAENVHKDFHDLVHVVNRRL